MTINTVQRTTHRVRGLLALAMISSFIFLVAESSSGVPAARVNYTPDSGVF